MAENVKNDPILGLTAAVVTNLRADARSLRREQRRRERSNLGPDKELVEMVSNNARASASVCSEVRKMGKDIRETGKKWSPMETVKAFMVFLREQPSARRSEFLAQLQAAVSDG